MTQLEYNMLRKEFFHNKKEEYKELVENFHNKTHEELQNSSMTISETIKSNGIWTMSTIKLIELAKNFNEEIYNLDKNKTVKILQKPQISHDIDKCGNSTKCFLSARIIKPVEANELNEHIEKLFRKKALEKIFDSDGTIPIPDSQDLIKAYLYNIIDWNQLYKALVLK